MVTLIVDYCNWLTPNWPSGYGGLFYLKHEVINSTKVDGFLQKGCVTNIL